MKVSLNWLKDYVDLSNISIEELSKIISTNIVEIEAEYKLINATNLCVGHVLECEAHPDSDHLHVCKVDIGTEVSQIVCGAPNVAKGQYVIVALIGAVLPGDFKIKPSKIRGVESNGMLCSLQELGFEEKYVPEAYKNGIYLLDDKAKVGTTPLEYLGLDDYVFDLELTSNRSDLLSIEGVAYDVATMLKQKIKEQAPIVKEDSSKNPMKVVVETKQCPKYLTRYVKNVVIKESPNFIKARLIASGIRPINNVVDITNYVLMELGQPLHSFDADKLGDTILVRNALANETMVTLDNIERKLVNTDIVITDGKKPVCIAGVMGGLDTEVTNTTKNVVLEAAYFEPLSIRKTSSRLGLKSESSTRFERRIDYKRVNRALEYACSLLEKYAQGTTLSNVVGYETPNYYQEQIVKVTTSKINKVLGTSLLDEEVKDIFTRLAYKFECKNNEYIITLPSRRMDLEGWDQHVIEDVARIYGYDNIPTILASTNDKGLLTPYQKFIRNIRYVLSNLGLNETVTYSLISKNHLNDFTTYEAKSIDLLMPLTEDRAVMRQSLLNGLCEAIAYNRARRVENMSFFEIGKRYDDKSEITLLSGAFTGLFNSSLWQGTKQVSDFFLVKGVLEVLFDKINVNVTYQADTLNNNFHPGKTAKIMVNDQMIGLISELHPRYIKNNDLPKTVVFELNLDLLYSLLNKEYKYEVISKFPTITRDLAIVCKKNITAKELIDLIKQTSKKLLIDISVFDLYMGDNVASDEKSIAVKMTFQDKEKTLESSDVDKVINSIINRLDHNFKARLR